MTLTDTKQLPPQARDDLDAALRARLAGKAKPPGSLGRIEELAHHIGLVTGSLAPRLGAARIVVFAADHGLTAEGVTAYPSSVTREIAKLILAGGAGINVFARAAGIGVTLVDAGMLEPLDPHVSLLSHRIAAGTRNARHQPAMDDAELGRALEAGAAVDRALDADRVGIVGYGEVGIGNSSAAALIAHALTSLPLDVLVGPGAGAPAGGLQHKRDVLRQVAARAALPDGTPAQRARAALREFGGFEIAMLAGAMIAARRARRIIVVDGFISTAAALAADALDAGLLRDCVFAHGSAEPGHRAVLEHVAVTPLLQLDLRLGEGTGAALAIPLVRAAELMLRDMADLPGAHPV